jgi:hypothetical protein
MISTNLEKRKEFYESNTLFQMTPSQTLQAGSQTHKTTPKGESRFEMDGDMLQSQISDRLRKAERNYI